MKSVRNVCDNEFQMKLVEFFIFFVSFDKQIEIHPSQFRCIAGVLSLCFPSHTLLL